MLAPVFSCPFARPVAALALGLVLGAPEPARAAPELGLAARALLETPLDVTGDVLGGAGLVAAASVALVGDTFALVDAKSPARHLLRGVASGGLHRVAFGISRASTGTLEVLRQEDIERWPEPSAAYLEADPFVGRVDQFGSGLGAVLLGVRDLFGGPALALLHGCGASSRAESLARWRTEDRIDTLGPEPAADAHPARATSVDGR